MKSIAICVLVSYLAFCSQASGQGGIITAIAGTNWTFPTNATVALNAPLGPLFGVALDSQINVYVSDTGNNLIFRVSPGGGIQIVAGSGNVGFSGDGGTATSASLAGPSGVAVDASGDLFIADSNNQRVRKVSAGGIITTVAGNGTEGFSGDGGPATSASLADPSGVAVDTSGNLFIVDTGNYRIRKVTASGMITTVAGGAACCSLGNGGPATAAWLAYPEGIALDASGNLFIADWGNSLIRKVSVSGIITSVAGNGNFGFSGDGGPATLAELSGPYGVALDASGNLFIADNFNYRLRKVSASGIITTVAGDGSPGFSGDGGRATSASLGPAGVAVDASGNLFIADNFNERVRKVSAIGIITTIAGNGGYRFSGDGGPAASTSLNNPVGVTVDSSGNLFIADSGNNRIRKVSASGIITTVAGSGIDGFSGDGGSAISASLDYPAGVAVDASGNLFIVDLNNNRIRKVSASGVITTVAGNGTLGFSGDGGPATSGELYYPQAVAVDASGNLFIADSINQRIRKVSASGIITTVAGGGTPGSSGDGGPATSASLIPAGVAVDTSGNLFIADTFHESIRKVSAGGIITTVAGDGASGFAGDGGPATSASLRNPQGVAVDASGNLFIADSSNSRIRKVSAGGIIATVAGDGTPGLSGDGGPATSASLNSPYGVTVDSSGNLFIADSSNSRIREVSPAASSAPSLAVSPTSLSFSLVAGGSSSQQINLASSVAGLAWSASTSASWITLSPTSGTAPATITVAINTAPLHPGTYAASITVLNPMASPSQESVSVSLTVTGVAPSLSVAPAMLNFQAQQDAPAQSQSIQIGGTAGTAWQATAATSTGGAWLTASPGAGQIPAALAALVNSNGLTAGTYQGAITVQAPGATPSSSTISITLTVTAATGQSGIITTYAGDGNGYSGDGGPAAAAGLDGPSGLAIDGAGNLYIADTGNNVIRKVTPGGIITTFAGNGNAGFSGDGGPATAAALNINIDPVGIAVDAAGNLYIADSLNNRVRKVSTSGIITTVAGNGFGAQDGLGGFSGDGGPATSAELFAPTAVAVDAVGNLFIADLANMRIRKVSASGIITTVAGSGCTLTLSTPNCGGFSGDGGPATSATLNRPAAIVVDGSGNLFFADNENNRIRKVSASGIITTVAGIGPACAFSSNTCTGSFSGDGGPATLAALNFPEGLFVDGSGNLYIGDTGNLRVRKLSASGIITTIAGDGIFDYNIFDPAGDGGPATSAELNLPEGVVVDASGNIFISDNLRGRVREVSAPVTPPSITSGAVVPACGGVNTIEPGEWSSIYGSNLAASTAYWNSNFPTSLGGVSVKIDGRAAYLSYVSPGQINFQVPDDTTSGSVSVVVTTTNGSGQSTVTLGQLAPCFATLDGRHVAGIIPRSNGSGAYGGGAYDIVGPTGSSLGYPTVAAKAGDVVELFGTGFGPTNPSVPAGQAFSGAAPTTNPVTVLIDNISVAPFFSGLSGAGLVQINLTIPPGLGIGDVPVTATVGGSGTPSGVVISLN